MIDNGSRNGDNLLERRKFTEAVSQWIAVFVESFSTSYCKYFSPIAIVRVCSTWTGGVLGERDARLVGTRGRIQNDKFFFYETSVGKTWGSAKLKNILVNRRSAENEKVPPILSLYFLLSLRSFHDSLLNFRLITELRDIVSLRRRNINRGQKSAFSN